MRKVRVDPTGGGDFLTIQTAVDALVGGGVGGEIDLAPGIHRFRGPITIPAGAKISIVGRDTTLVREE